MRIIWTDDEKDSLRRNWKRPDWIQIIIEETGMSEKQIKNKAQSMGLKRRRLKVLTRVRESQRDPEPLPAILKSGICPHGGMLWAERVPAVPQNMGIKYDLVCIHGGRYPIP